MFKINLIIKFEINPCKNEFARAIEISQLIFFMLM